jgi:hypothetical protein
MKGSGVNGAKITPVKSAKSTGTIAQTNRTSKELSRSAEESTSERILQPKTAAPIAAPSVVPRTPSPRPRSAVDEGSEVVDEQPEVQGSEIVEDSQGQGIVESADKDEAASQETPRAAIIGRVGLAGAREAPTTSEDINDTSTIDQKRDSSETPITTPADDNDENPNTNDAEASAPTGALDKALLAGLHPGDIDSSGHVEDPEMPRSAPSPDQNANPTRNPFGRIGHPGAGAGKHELESPNPKSDSVAEKKSDTSKKETEWHEEELQRDTAKTIVSPDAAKGKGAFEGKKE